MIKQLILMFIASVILSLVLEAHELGLLYANHESLPYLIGYVLGCALALMLISLILASIPRIIFWAAKIKQAPRFMMLAWSTWILMMVIVAASQLYGIAVHPEPVGDASSTTGSNRAQTVYRMVADSIYAIQSTEKASQRVASGGAVAISEDYLATNCHIIINPSNIYVTINEREKHAKLYSAHDDLCIISVDGMKFNPVKMRRAKSVNIGEDVYAIGNPEDFERTISDGIISNKLNNHGIIILQTNASISHGSSGGGLFDHDGNLVGITTSSKSSDSAQNINFALPTEMIEAALLEPTTDSMTADKATSTSSTKASHTNDAPSENDYQVIGTYGKDRIVLAYWYDRCYVLIPGRYNAKSLNSVAVWIPSSPDTILLLSRVTSIDGVFRFIKWVDTAKSVDIETSKSYVFYGDKLERLGIVVVDKAKQPAYVMAQDKPYTQSLIAESSLIGQFYNYTHSGYDGLTSITFGLSGFTDALAAYNENCKSNR